MYDSYTIFIIENTPGMVMFVLLFNDSILFINFVL